MKPVEDRILASSPRLDAESPDELWRRIKRVLNDAFGEGLLATPQHEIHQHVKLLPGNNHDEYQIVGGIKDFHRRPESALLRRDDKAWLHFTLTVRARKHRDLEMLAYNFELVFPPGHVPPFVRLDLNPPGHDNESEGMRSHMHPGHRDLKLPAPMMTPAEILRLLLHHLRPRSNDKPRA